MLALDNGSHGSVGTLLEHFASVNETPAVDADYEHGRLALLFAIYNNDVSAVQALLDANADANARNQQGRTPLMMAVELGHSEVAVVLLHGGADVQAIEAERSDWTALHIAAYEPQPECVRVLLEHGAQVDARDNSQWTPLIWAAWARSAVAVRLLLESGADVHAENDEGGSALAQAGWLGDKDTIQVLLEWGAASNAEHLRDAFHAAFTDNNRDKAPLFIEAGLKMGLAEAVLMEDEARTTILLADGVDQDELNRGLMTAAGHGSPEILRLLIQNGADPNSASDDQTPLMQAYWNTNYAFHNIEVLLRAGGNVNARNEHGETPFTMRTGCLINEPWRLRLMRKMLKCGADVNAQSDAGMTALMEAAWRGEMSIARFLLKNGAQVNLRELEGRTALLFAATEGHTRMVRLLLKYGATATERASDGTTALSLAKRWVGKKIASLLIEAGAVEQVMRC